MLMLDDASAVSMLNKITITLHCLQRRILCGIPAGLACAHDFIA